MASQSVSVPGYGNKTERVYAALRDEFVRGEWSFGTTFSTYELASRFGVSRRPVMDAALRLEAEGFMEIIPQVGCRVVTPDEARMREQFELASALEGTAARLAAARAEERDVDRLEAIQDRSEQVRDAEEYAELNGEFHMTILDIAGNRTIADLGRSSWALREFYIGQLRQALPDPGLESRHVEHRAIIDAIRAKKPDLARKRMEHHIEPERAVALMQVVEHQAAATLETA